MPELLLTSSQSKLINELSHFSLAGKNLLIITGSAGTGKTFLLTQIIKRMTKSYRVCSPTGRSAQILREKGVKDAVTIHSMLYSYDRSTEVDDSDNIITYFKMKGNNDPEDTFYFIDEASMISNEYSSNDSLRFGSGYLLKDLLEFIDINVSNNRKIVFIGDNAQLPPVNSNFSPALSIEYLSLLQPQFFVSNFQLNEIVRQVGESGIVLNANSIRDQIVEKSFDFMKLEFNHHDFIDLPPEEIIYQFVNHFSEDPQNVVMLAHMNSSIKLYNDAIRERLGLPQHLSENDRIIVVRNNMMYGVFNGQMGEIKYVSENVEKRRVTLKRSAPVVLKFRNVAIEFTNETGKPFQIEALVLENLIYSGNPQLNTNEYSALWRDFRNRYKDLTNKPKELAELAVNDPYLNALQIKFGYAITVHKSQGGEWKNVFFDFKSNINHKTENYFRICYTAITRARENLYAISAPSQNDFEMLT